MKPTTCRTAMKRSRSPRRRRWILNPMWSSTLFNVDATVARPTVLDGEFGALESEFGCSVREEMDNIRACERKSALRPTDDFEGLTTFRLHCSAWYVEQAAAPVVRPRSRGTGTRIIGSIRRL